MSENAKRDSNHVPVLLGWTGTEVVMIRANAAGVIQTAPGGGGTPEHHNGIAPNGSWATITLSGSCSSLNFHNTSIRDIRISFDSGVTYYTIETGAYWNVDLAVTSFQIWGVGASATYESVAVV